MNAPEAVFSIESEEYFCTAEFIGYSMQGWGLIVFRDDGFI